MKLHHHHRLPPPQTLTLVRLLSPLPSPAAPPACASSQGAVFKFIIIESEVAMSLISQNTSAIDRVKKSKREPELPRVEDSDDAPEKDELSDVVSSPKKRKKKKKREADPEKQEQEEREMKRLENFLFGSLYSPVVFGKDEDDEAKDDAHDSSPLFVIDNTPSTDLPIYDLRKGIDDEKGNEQRKPAWVDEEDENMNINIAKVNRLRKLRKEEDETIISGSAYVSRLRAQHEKLNPGTDWACPVSKAKNYSSDEASEVENDPLARGYDATEGVDDILRTNEDLVMKSGARLLPGLLEYSRLVDANKEDPCNGPINSVQFHRNGQLLLAAGLDKKLRFFQIDGKRNTKIQSIFLEDCPIKKASFLPDGSQVIVSGRRKFFYCFDLVKAKCDRIGPLTGREEKSLEVFEVSPDSSTIAFTGNEGYILLVSAKTKSLIGTLKMNGTVRSLAFSKDGNQLLSSGGDGQIYHWDLRTMTCFHKGIDEGCLTGTALSTSPVRDLFAAGSSSGIVNLYNTEGFVGGKHRPLKTIENLATEVNFMKFNHDAQMLAICSHMKKNSMKLIHIPSFTVFSNWPPPNRNLHYPRCVDFSPRGGFMAVGNAAGTVLLYKLHHYQHA
ncbi:U3 small nucleolar RNA-associated protein 18-like protein [Drosera capensis]